MGPHDRFLRTPLTRQQLTHNAPPFPQIVPLLSQLVPLITGWGLYSTKIQFTKSKPLLSLTQINLKKKKNAWDTLIAFNKNTINPIILAKEPYSNKNNIIPKINQNQARSQGGGGGLGGAAAARKKLNPRKKKLASSPHGRLVTGLCL